MISSKIKASKDKERLRLRLSFFVEGIRRNVPYTSLWRSLCFIYLEKFLGSYVRTLRSNQICPYKRSYKAVCCFFFCFWCSINTIMVNNLQKQPHSLIHSWWIHKVNEWPYHWYLNNKFAGCVLMIWCFLGVFLTT